MNVLALFMIFGGVLLRLVPHVPNFAPISAMAIFGGAYLSRKFAVVIPLGAMILSDYLLLYVNPFGNMLDFSKIYPVSAMFHSTTLYVWGSFLVSSLIGMWLKNRKKPSSIILGSFLASLQFFLITNFGVWAAGAYSRGVEGLMQSYIMGLPFFRWTLMGDLFYTATFFIVFQLALMAYKPKTVSSSIVQ